LEVAPILLSHIEVLSPRSVRDALKALDDYQLDIRIVAGSTDVSVMLKDGNMKEKRFLDISRLEDLKHIIVSRDGLIHIGAVASYGDCLRSPIIRKKAGILLDSFLTIGSPQIRNLATIAGNLETASPAGDAIPPLFALDATIVLESLSRKREIAVEKFLTGYRKTMREPNELITEVKFHPVNRDEVTFFRKLGLRHANSIALASVAFWGKVREGPVLSEARIALGAVAPTVIRARGAEEALVNSQLTDDRVKAVARTCASEAQPISDIRGSADYRRRAVNALMYVGIRDVFERLGNAIGNAGVKSTR
jgi:carbon-monoxide dehydrogenase medium subunit